MSAGGFKAFGPTYNSTPYVRIGYEGVLNGTHPVDVAAANAVNGELAGKIAAIGKDGVKLAGAGGAGAIGLIREDLGDMINASGKATFYFRGGEYYVAESRLGSTIDKFVLGAEVTTDANGKLVPATGASGEKAVGVVVYTGAFTNGNMYEWAGAAANGGNFLGFILYM
jgi:hypothetical protein